MPTQAVDYRTEQLSIPLDELREAHIHINFGGGEMIVGEAPPGMLVSGTFVGGVIRRSPAPGQVELEPVDPARVIFDGCERRWDLGITSAIPVDLRLDSGANKTTIDLGPLKVRRLEFHIGASDTHVRLPERGQTTFHADVGMAQLTIEVPAGMAARIRGKMGLGSVKVDPTRFPRTSDGWASPGYEAASDRVDIEVRGGLGSVVVS